MVCSFNCQTLFVTSQSVVHGGRQCNDSFCSFAMVRDPHVAVNISCLLAIFKEGTGNGYHCLADTDDTQQTHCSWHMNVLLVKLKTLGLDFFFFKDLPSGIAHVSVQFIFEHTQRVRGSVILVPVIMHNISTAM